MWSFGVRKPEEYRQKKNMELEMMVMDDDDEMKEDLRNTERKEFRTQIEAENKPSHVSPPIQTPHSRCHSSAEECPETGKPQHTVNAEEPVSHHIVFTGRLSVLLAHLIDFDRVFSIDIGLFLNLF